MDRLLQNTLRRAKKSLLLLGPRQTGKSTLMQALGPDLTINLARESELLAFAANPGELEQRLAAHRPRVVFVDEVQRLPSLLNTIQAVLDETKARGEPLRFLLTGSSARKLRRGQANLLPGRVLTYALGALVAAELGHALDLRRALEVGTLPEPYLEADRPAAEKLLASYAGTYVKEEIQAEALTRNLQGFSRFLATAAAASGQLLDFSKLANAARVSRTGTVNYFEILEDTLLAFRVPPFPEAPKADLVKHPRYYFFDPGVLNGLLGSFVASPDRIGNLFEHLVASQLRASAAATDRQLDLFAFRTRGGLEVDFVARLDGKLWAIKAKATTHANSGDASGLVRARVHLPRRTPLVVVTLGGPARRLDSGVDILPLNELLRRMFG